MIIVGTHLYGENEAFESASGRCYVTTQFVHVLFVPLVPLQSLLVRASSPEHGKKIGASWRNVVSVYTQWAAAVLFIWGLISAGNAAVLVHSFFYLTTAEDIGRGIDGDAEIIRYASDMAYNLVWALSSPCFLLLAVGVFLAGRRMFASATDARREVLQTEAV